MIKLHSHLNEYHDLAHETAKYPRVCHILQKHSSIDIANIYYPNLKYGEGGTECEDQDIGDGQVDQEDVDQGPEIIVGGHGETDEDIAQHSAQHQDNIDGYQQDLVVRHLRKMKYKQAFSETFANLCVVQILLIACIRPTKTVVAETTVLRHECVLTLVHI